MPRGPSDLRPGTAIEMQVAARDFGRARGALEPRVAASEVTCFPFLAGLRDAAVSGARARISVNTGDRRANGDIYHSSRRRRGKGLTPHPRTGWAGIPHIKSWCLSRMATRSRSGPGRRPSRRPVSSARPTSPMGSVTRASPQVAAGLEGDTVKAALLAPDDGWQRDHFTPGREKIRKRLLFR